MAQSRQARISDLPHFVPNLRKADIDESRAFLGVHPGMVLPSLICNNQESSWSIEDNHGEVVGMYGVAPVAEQPLLGAVWMVATPKLKTIQKQFLRECHQHIQVMHAQGYPILFAYTDARNVLHHKWLRWCGFQFISRKPVWGAEGRSFYEVIHSCA